MFKEKKQQFNIWLHDRYFIGEKFQGKLLIFDLVVEFGPTLVILAAYFLKSWTLLWFAIWVQMGFNYARFKKGDYYVGRFDGFKEGFSRSEELADDIEASVLKTMKKAFPGFKEKEPISHDPT